MKRLPAKSTRTDTLFPQTTLLRSGDGDFSSAPVAAYIGLADRHNSVQQEFLIPSDNSGGIQWIVGGNFFQIKSLSRLAVPQATAAFNVFKTIRTQALAASVDIPIPITQEIGRAHV